MPVVCNFVKEFNLKNAVKYSIMLSIVGTIAEESRAECNFSIFREKIDKRIDLILDIGCDPASTTCTTGKTKWHGKLLTKKAQIVIN